MSSIVVQEAADMLQTDQDPTALKEYVQNQMQEGDHSTVLANIRSLWRQKHGDSVVKRSEGYRHGVCCVARRLNELASDTDTAATDIDTARNVKARVLEFLQLSFSEQYSMLGILSDATDASYTGCRKVDALLRNITAMPAYVEALRAECQEPTSVVSTVASADAAQSVSDTVQHLPMMLSVLTYPRARPFELLCALAYVSGRSLAELVSLGNFKAAADEQRTVSSSFHPCIAFTVKCTQQTESCVIPLLCDAEIFLAAVQRLRQAFASHVRTCQAINNSHCKTVNAAAKALLGGEQYMFTDLRVAYAVLTFMRYGKTPEAADGSDICESALTAWILRCMPLCRLARNARFRGKCFCTLRQK